MGKQVVDVFHFLRALSPDPEQTIDVPKIILEDIPTRISSREPQLAEQLAEVPTSLYFLEQTVDIPVPRGGKRRLQGFSQNRVRLRLLSSRPLTFQFLVVFLAMDVLKVFSRLEKTGEIPPGGGLQDFLPDQGFAASSPVMLEEPFQGVCRTFFPGGKSAKVTRQVRASVPQHTSSSKLSAHQMPAAHREDFFIDDAGSVWMRCDTGQWKLLGTDTDVFQDEPGSVPGERHGVRLASSCYFVAGCG